MAERQIGTDKLKVYNDWKGEEAKLLPTAADLKEFYKQKLDAQIGQLSELCTIATYTRGLLDTDFDAAVATLNTGMMWMNQTPDGTNLLSPPSPYKLPESERVWKFGDASGRKKWGRLELNPKKEQVPFKIFHEQTCYSGTPQALFKNTPVVFNKDSVLLVVGEGSETFQIQGDSGSALLDEQNRLIGLMSTGGMGITGYAIPIGVVFAKLNVKFPAKSSGMS